MGISSPQSHQQTPPPKDLTPSRRSSFGRILILVGMIIVLGAAGIGAWMYFRPRAQTPARNDQTTPAALAPVDLHPNDADRDGFSNDEEKTLGLNEKEFDTDGDGLTDADEVRVWKTDPKKADTDGDGFLDGVEIISGYNPLGAGKR